MHMQLSCQSDRCKRNDVKFCYIQSRYIQSGRVLRRQKPAASWLRL